jgi:Fe-S-cluster-containing dehydrogenase component
MSEIKLGFLDKEMTRRQFVKISGKSLAGLTLSAGMLSLLGVSQAQVDSGQVATWATPEGLLVVNSDICVGCLRCESNCTTVNDGAASSHNARIKITRNLMSNSNGLGMYADLNDGMSWTYFPDTCRQCETPPCGEACPVGAIQADDRGVKIVDENVCISCGMCVAACPWSMIVLHNETNKATKCINCGICVEGCPTGALSVVPWTEVRAMAQLTWAG